MAGLALARPLSISTRVRTLVPACSASPARVSDRSRRSLRVLPPTVAAMLSRLFMEIYCHTLAVRSMLPCKRKQMPGRERAWQAREGRHCR